MKDVAGFRHKGQQEAEYDVQDHQAEKDAGRYLQLPYNKHRWAAWGAASNWQGSSWQATHHEDDERPLGTEWKPMDMQQKDELVVTVCALVHTSVGGGGPGLERSQGPHRKPLTPPGSQA